MATIKEESISYKPQQLFNIADLPEISVDFEVREETKVNADEEEYTYKYIDLNSKKYRMPSTVFEEIQKILKVKSDIKFVKVTKTGEGKKTRYAVEVVE